MAKNLPVHALSLFKVQISCYINYLDECMRRRLYFFDDIIKTNLQLILKKLPGFQQNGITIFYKYMFSKQPMLNNKIH